MAAIPTTAGTGSEATPVAVITCEGGEKRGVNSPALIADWAALDASLTLFRQVGNGSETLADGAVARQGDVIRVGYHAAGRAYGVILSIDGRSHVTVHLPTGGDRAVALGREPTVLLDQAYELDDAPRLERFYFITGEGPFPIAPIVASAQRAIATADGDAIPALPLAAGLQQSVFSLQKESAP